MTEPVLPPKWAFPEQKAFAPPGVCGISELSVRDEKRKTSVKRATHAVVDLGAIAYNISEIRKRIGEKRDLMAVVKADGYGHGAVEVSRTALKHGANCLGVATPEEGQQLREAGIDVPVLVLGLIQPEEAYKVADFGLEQTICSLDLAEELNQIAANTGTRINTHIKLDTGMGRVGLVPQRGFSLYKKSESIQKLELERDI